MLAFSRQQTLRPQVLQLPDVVSEVSHLLKRLLGETVELVVKHGRSLGPVRADPGQLEQVIVNLAVNARDAMAEKGGGALTIQTYSVKANQVAELGSDILPIADYSALVGDRHRRRHCAEHPRQGVRAVLHHQGDREGHRPRAVDGLRHRQAIGRLHLRRFEGRGGDPLRHLSSRPPRGRAASRSRKVEKTKKDELWGSGTVLLVEDEPMVRAVAERALTRHGYRVITADNGEEALEQLSKGEHIDLLISDVVMPGMDGPTVVREARKSRPDLKILFMSGYAEEQLRNSIDIENVNFLPKPFSVAELAEAARRAAGAK